VTAEAESRYGRPACGRGRPGCPERRRRGRGHARARRCPAGDPSRSRARCPRASRGSPAGAATATSRPTPTHHAQGCPRVARGRALDLLRRELHALSTGRSAEAERLFEGADPPADGCEAQPCVAYRLGVAADSQHEQQDAEIVPLKSRRELQICNGNRRPSTFRARPNRGNNAVWD
jgi:hypothetical protein